MLPRAFCQTVVARQRIRIGAHIGSALHVVVAAENVGATTRLAHVAQSQLQDARGANNGVANGMLRLAHAPHNGAGVVVVQHFGDFENLLFLHAASFFHLVRCPLGHDVGFDSVHAIHTVVDVLLVFPSIFEDVIQDAEQERNVGARANAHVFVGSCRCACEAWIDHDHLAAIFFGMQHVQHADRVCFGSVGANVHGALAVLHVVVRIGHGAVAPCIGHTGNGGGVANTRLVIGVVGAPEADKLAHEIRLFVVVLGGTNEVNAVRAAGFAQVGHALADFFEGHVPADALVFAVDQLHGVTQAVFAVAVFAQCCTFGAVRAQVDGGVEHGLLTNPHAVFNDGIYRATHGAVCANGALDFHFASTHCTAVRHTCLSFFDQAQLRCSEANTDTQTRTAQKRASVKGGQCLSEAAAQAVHKRGR